MAPYGFAASLAECLYCRRTAGNAAVSQRQRGTKAVAMRLAARTAMAGPPLARKSEP